MEDPQDLDDKNKGKLKNPIKKWRIQDPHDLGNLHLVGQKMSKVYFQDGSQLIYVDFADAKSAVRYYSRTIDLPLLG